MGRAGELSRAYQDELQRLGIVDEDQARGQVPLGRHRAQRRRHRTPRGSDGTRRHLQHRAFRNDLHPRRQGVRKGGMGEHSRYADRRRPHQEDKRTTSTASIRGAGVTKRRGRRGLRPPSHRHRQPIFHPRRSGGSEEGR